MWWWPMDRVPPGRAVVVNGAATAEPWGRIYEDDGNLPRRAAADFLATAQAIREVVGQADTAPAVGVLGTGLLATLVRERLRRVTTDTVSAVVDTTGEAKQIWSAVARLPRSGRLVLGAPPRIQEVQLATYRDVHVRALTLVGVPWGVCLKRTVDPSAVDRLLHRAPLASGPRDGWYLVRAGEE